MKKNIKKALLFSSILFLSGATALVSCGSNEPVNVKRFEINTQISDVNDITVNYSTNKPALGETVTGTLTYDATKFEIISITEINGLDIYQKDDKTFQFIMPNHNITIKIQAKRIFSTTNLLEKLTEIKNGRNYTVKSQIETKTDVADAYCYFTEDAYLKELTQYDTQTGELLESGVSITGEINHPDGVYQFIYDDEKEQVYTSKVLYQSVKKGYNSFWDAKHNVTGLHDLSLNYVRPTDEVYIFKAGEIGNINAVFENTFIPYEVVKEYNPIITASVNPKDNLQFEISMAGYGKIIQEVVLVNKTTIPVIEDFLANGGGPVPSVLTPDQKTTIEKISLNNYIQKMQDVKNGDKVIERGKIYYTDKYIYTDYTDEYIAYKQSKGETFVDEGYVQDGNDVVKFEVHDGKINLIEISRIKNTTIAESQNYLSTYTFFKEYKHAQTIQIPTGGNGYFIYDEIDDRAIIEEFSIKTLKLDPEDYNTLMLLEAIQTCGIQPITSEGNLNLFVFAMLPNPNNGQPELALLGATFSNFGEAKVQLMEDYLTK